MEENNLNAEGGPHASKRRRTMEENEASDQATPPLVVPTISPVASSSRYDEQGWQESRVLLKDRASFLLNNQRMSDIKFLLGDEKVEVYAHKTILAMGSPVFEAQFFGPMSLNLDVIALPDLEAETFRIFLKYLYTDELDESIDDTQVLFLLRPARKYIVPHLVEKCSDMLMAELKPENVFQVYSYAVFFDLKKLEGACLRYIDRECEYILETEEFTCLNIETLSQFLKRDGLNINELTLYKAVIKWAEIECGRKLVEPNDENIREVISCLLPLVRFPAMTAEEFASEVASRNILTAEESRAIFIYMCRNPCRIDVHPMPLLVFPTSKRLFYPQHYIVSRFADEPIPHNLNYRSGEIYNYKINFSVDRQVFFKGINIFSIRCGSTGFHDQRRFNGSFYLEEYNTNDNLDVERRRKNFLKEGSLEPEAETSVGSRYFPVFLDKEFRIVPNKLYTVGVVVSVASTTYQQQALNTYMGKDEAQKVEMRCPDGLVINFTFLNFPGEMNVGNFTKSQIPEIVFTL